LIHNFGTLGMASQEPLTSCSIFGTDLVKEPLQKTFLG
jgi:hypothetical protein